MMVMSNKVGSIMKQHSIVIRTYEDYKTYFGDKYCEGKNIKKQFYSDSFVFYFENCFDHPNILRGFEQIKEKYKNIIYIQSVIIMSREQIVKVNIQKSQDYAAFYDEFIDVIESNYIIKKKYWGFEFRFEICYLDDKINEFLIHNYILLRYKLLNSYYNFKLYIYGDENNQKSHIARITTYVADCETIIKDSIFFNGFPLFHKEMNIGKLFPAMFIDEETLRFLRDPINPNVWDRIVELNKIESNSFDELEDSEQYTKHWFLLQVCKKYLFEQFDNNESNKYTQLRRSVFRSKKFKNHILRIPLLATILFAQYDYFYRNSMLRKYKDNIGRYKLNWADLILDIQENQDYDSYKKYKEMCKNDENIKTLIKFRYFDKTKGVPNLEEENIIIHKVIISEVFEATTIAEGLLQLMENAVEHAKGGLLSIRIRENREQQDSSYLLKEYNQYFTRLNDIEGAKFYLEVKLSDIAETNLKRTFLNNIKIRCTDNPMLKGWYEKYEEAFENCTDIFSPFFSPDEHVKSAWNSYYEISDNQVHHFGLQIFDSIITTKNGLLNISGHGDEYTQKNCKIDSDINIKGTSYRILLPINQLYKHNKSIIVDTVREKIIDYNMIDEYRINGFFNVFEPKWIDILKFIKEYRNGESGKELVVSKIAKCFSDSYKGGKCLLLIDYNMLDYTANYAIELLLKGLFIFILSDTQNNIPISIINLNSHALLEASRIVALFYGKSGEAVKSMENTQIYMRGNDIGEEILFSGNNLNRNADRLRRVAMTRGLMFEYWQIAQMLMQRTVE